MSSVPSVDPSLTITHFRGRAFCATTDLRVNSMNCASLRAGVTRTYVYDIRQATTDDRAGSASTAVSLWSFNSVDIASNIHACDHRMYEMRTVTARSTR